MIDLQRVGAVHPLPVIIGRQDIEHRELRQPAGMVEREAIGDAAAAVVAGQREVHVTEPLHHLHHRLGHRALAVGDVQRIALGHVGPAIARQIGDDQREVLGQLRRDLVPHHMGLGEAVQEQQRRPAAADAGEDPAEGGVDPFGGKIRIKVGEIGHLVASLRGQSGPAPDT
ncbi:hypothetical protein ABH973_001372 [Bradyrhizobium ottawaense]